MNIDNKKLYLTILAGGLGKRMQSTLPKVLHLVNGLPMIVRLLNETKELKPYKIIIVVGQFKNVIDETIKKYIDVSKLSIEYAMQDVPLGTGHAVLCTLNLLDNDAVNLIVNGDNPLLTANTMKDALHNFINNNNTLQITAIEANNPIGSGRIILNNNIFQKIVEEKDCNGEQRKIKLINCGIYLASTNTLKKYIPKIENNNIPKEYYLTDIVEVCQKDNLDGIGLFVIDKEKELEIINVNTKEQLDNLNNVLITI